MKVYFRADANSEVGHGHVIRCLALAEILKPYFSCCFISYQLPNSLYNLVLDNCEKLIQLKDPKNTFELTQIIGINNCLVLDGYHFDFEYQSALKKEKLKIVFIDDLAAFYQVADVVINHSPIAHQLNYQSSTNTKLCFGSSFSLLRKPFYLAMEKERIISTINSCLVCFGGSDYFNLTSFTLKSLNHLNKIKKVTVLLGGSNLNSELIQKTINESLNLKVETVFNLSAQEVVSCFQNHHLAIVPSSGILIEALSVKIGVITGYYADNQKGLNNGYSELGVAFSIGDFTKLRQTQFANEIENYLNSNQIESQLEKQAQLFTRKIENNLLQIFKNLQLKD